MASEDLKLVGSTCQCDLCELPARRSATASYTGKSGKSYVEQARVKLPRVKELFVDSTSSNSFGALHEPEPVPSAAQTMISLYAEHMSRTSSKVATSGFGRPRVSFDRGASTGR